MHASLGFIGRAQTVDSDELPQEDNTNSLSKIETVNSDDHKTLMTSLNEKTISLHYFKHSFLKSNLSKMTFHCNHNFVIERNIKKIVEFNMRLQGLEVYNFMLLKLGEFFDLISQITRLIINEHLNLKLARSELSRDSRLECLRGFCENLRICFNNTWSLCNFVKSNSIICLNLQKFQDYLERYIVYYHRLTTTTIKLSQEFVSNGLLVLSHSDLLKYTHDDLWEISRGIEEYNIIIEHTLFQKRFSLVRDFYLETSRVNVNLNSINKHIDEQLYNIRTMSFSKILYKLASERSLLIAHSVHNYFYNSPLIIKQIKLFLQKSHQNSKSILEFNENLFNFEKCLSTMKQIGSPVNDYLRMEYEFTSNFLDIISQSTEMLKELNNTLPKRKLRKEDTVDNFMAPLLHQNIESISSGSKSSLLSVNKVCQRRKGVQWSDHTDVSLRHQVIGRYLSVVWKLVNDLLSTSKYSYRFQSLNEDYKGLGSWLLLNKNSRKIIGILFERIAKPDIFPIGFIPILLHQAELIEYENLLLLWDQGMCNSTLLNIDTPSLSQMLDDDVSEILTIIYRHLQSQAKQFNLDNSKAIKETILKATNEEDANIVATLVSVGLNTLLKYGEKFGNLSNYVLKQHHFPDIAQLLWPIIHEWAKNETHFNSIYEPKKMSFEDDNIDSHLSYILLLQRIPNLAVEDTINNLNRVLVDAYKVNCTERINQLLDIESMQKSLSIDTFNGTSRNSLPSTYAQKAIMEVLEPLYQSIPNNFNLSICDALSITIDVFCKSWLTKIEILSSKEDILINNQLQTDVNLIRVWINSKEAIPESIKRFLFDTNTLIELEERVHKHLESNPKSEISYLHRQTSEIGLKVVQGCVRLCEELCSKSTNASDSVLQTQLTKSSSSHPFHNLLTKSGQKYFRSNKSDK